MQGAGNFGGEEVTAHGTGHLLHVTLRGVLLPVPAGVGVGERPYGPAPPGHPHVHGRLRSHHALLLRRPWQVP